MSKLISEYTDEQLNRHEQYLHTRRRNAHNRKAKQRLDQAIDAVRHEVNHRPRQTGMASNTFVIGLLCVAGLTWISLAPFIAMIPRGTI